mgnify:CR=1 FL=1
MLKIGYLPLTVEIKTRQRLSSTVPKSDRSCHKPIFRPKRVENTRNVVLNTWSRTLKNLQFGRNPNLYLRDFILTIPHDRFRTVSVFIRQVSRRINISQKFPYLTSICWHQTVKNWPNVPSAISGRNQGGTEKLRAK